MTVRFPKGELNMKQKREIVKKNAARSVVSGKKQRIGTPPREDV